MIRLDSISKQNGHQMLFIENCLDAGRPEGEKGWAGWPERSRQELTLFRMITGQEQPDDGLVVMVPE